MIEQKRTIPIVLATNDNYAPYAGVTITSLLDNASDEYFYDIYIFYTELSSDNINRFEKMNQQYKDCCGRIQIRCLNINSYIDKEVPLYENFHFSKEMYYRILIPTILTQYNKAIYLDCDMVVIGDISELFSIELGNNYVAGANDIQHYESKNYVKNVLNIDTNSYINSGVLVINCDAFRQYDLKGKCFDILKNSQIKFRYPDQDILNLVCKDKILFLEQKWNYIWHYNFSHYNRSELSLSDKDKTDYQAYSQDMKIIHYTSNIKPWNNYNIYLSKYFFDYARQTISFKDVIFNRWNHLRMKNYIVLQSIESKPEYFEITACFYSIEDYLYFDSLRIRYNGKEFKPYFYLDRNIDLRGTNYVQHFFNFKVKKANIGEQELRFSFFRKQFATEKLPVLSGKWFPVDMETESKCFFDRIAIGMQNKELVFSIASASEKKRWENGYVKKLLKSKKKACKKSAIVRIIYHMTKPFFRKKIWLLSDRENVAGDNGEAFFKWLKGNTKGKTVKPYFVINKKSSAYYKLKRIGRVVALGSYKFDVLFLHADKIVSSHLPRKLIEPYNTTYLKDLLYSKKTIFLQHGVTKDDISQSYSHLNQGIDALICVSEAEKDSIVSNFNYGLSEDKVLLTGFPRFDYLKNNPEKIVYFLPTWRKVLYDSQHDPTIFCESQYYKFFLELVSNNELSKVLRKNGFKLVIVPHELSKEVFASLQIDNPLISIETSGVCYSDIFKTGSALITDYSSVAFDFAYLHKPVVYCQFDREEFFNNHTYKKGYFSYEENGFGPVTTTVQDLTKALDRLLSNNCKMDVQYIKRVDSFFRYTDNNNCQRVFDAITNGEEVRSIKQRMIMYYKEHGCAETFRKALKRFFEKKETNK